jgi:hypothetical protein
VAEAEFWVDLFLKFSPDDFPVNEPWCDFMYPVLESMDTPETMTLNRFDLDNNKAVATLNIVVYWRKFIEHILSENSQGIVVVFHNECTDSFSYRIE